MSHEKAFGFCENLCEVEVEKTSNKVTGIDSLSTHDEYPSAKAVYSVLNQFSLCGDNTPWKNALFDTAMWYFYEGADTVGNDLPTANCIVLVFRKSVSRGVAFAFGWDYDGVSTNKTVWKNTCHDGWRGWTSLHSN